MALQWDQDKEFEEIETWANVKYIAVACPKCGRQRVELCANGKHWCEKCNWVIQDHKYFNPNWRI